MRLKSVFRFNSVNSKINVLGHNAFVLYVCDVVFTRKSSCFAAYNSNLRPENLWSVFKFQNIIHKFFNEFRSAEHINYLNMLRQFKNAIETINLINFFSCKVRINAKDLESIGFEISGNSVAGSCMIGRDSYNCNGI